MAIAAHSSGKEEALSSERVREAREPEALGIPPEWERLPSPPPPPPPPSLPEPEPEPLWMSVEPMGKKPPRSCTPVSMPWPVPMPWLVLAPPRAKPPRISCATPCSCACAPGLVATSPHAGTCASSPHTGRRGKGAVAADEAVEVALRVIPLKALAVEEAARVRLDVRLTSVSRLCFGARHSD